MKDQSAEGFTRLQPDREDYQTMKRPPKGGFEQDAFTPWRHWLCYFKKAGTVKKAKRQFNRRERREGKQGIRKELE